MKFMKEKQTVCNWNYEFDDACGWNVKFCRMRENKNLCLRNKNMKEVQEMLQQELQEFKKCYHYALSEGKNEEV